MPNLFEIWRIERTGFSLWSPVFVGLGVQCFFWSPVEPPAWVFALALSAPALLWALLWRWMDRSWLIIGMISLISAGFCAAGLRAHLVAAPVLNEHIDATVEGRIVSLNRSQSGRQRLLLDHLTIFGVGDADTPDRVQITLLSAVDAPTVKPGDFVSVLARLGPPGGPVEPGDFDFRRIAWFQGLGGIGYARGAPFILPPAGGLSIWDRLTQRLEGWRNAISVGIKKSLPGENGAIAAAITVGDRGGVSPESIDALRRSNLAHLLAISGLHMGMLTALVFAALRLALVMTPGVGKRWRVKSVAAGGALLAALAYLAVSGGSIATQRAFIMVAVALIAVMLNRPAITLRALSVAALLILILRPESLLHVGFQMSFAATAAIVAGFDAVRSLGWSNWIHAGGWPRRLAGYVGALAITSLLAGFATAPFGAFHFNQVAHYGLAANISSIPIMGLIVAPSALLAAIVAPLGLEYWPLQAMGAGLTAILSVAEFISSLDGAFRHIRAAPEIVLPMITLGGLVLCLFKTRLRLVGGPLVLVALVIWGVGQNRPELLIASEGRLSGLMTEAGRALDHKSAQAYAGARWLRRDGAPAPNIAAFQRQGFKRGSGVSMARLSNGWRVVSIYRNLNGAALAQLCRARTLLISRRAIDTGRLPCVAISGNALHQLGALSISTDGASVTVTSAEQNAGERYWTGHGR